MGDIFIPMSFFGALVLVMAQLTRLGSNLSLNRTIRDALRSDPASVPVLVQRLDARQPWADSLIGWIFIAFAIGLVLLALFERDVFDRREMVQAAIVPLVVGIVVLVYVRMAKKAAARDAASAHAVPVTPATPPASRPGRRTARSPKA